MARPARRQRRPGRLQDGLPADGAGAQSCVLFSRGVPESLTGRSSQWRSRHAKRYESALRPGCSTGAALLPALTPHRASDPLPGQPDGRYRRSSHQRTFSFAALSKACVYLQKASRTLETAGDIADQDPDSAYVLVYDAARYAGTAILAHRGLRPTTSGGHYALEVALRAQFGDGFRPFGAVRRRRNELEYPSASRRLFS